MTRRLRSLLAPLVWLWRGGRTLDAMPDGQQQSVIYTGCLHPPGCWSYCTGGYRYCLCCGQVRVKC